MQKEKKKIQDSLMKILLSKELKDIKMSEILSHAKLKSKKVQYLYESKEEIIICFFKRIDLTMKKKVQKIKLSRNIKDNLFEICMTRLDILNMHKNSINNIYSSLKFEPKLALYFYKSFLKSMNLMLELSLVKLDKIKGNTKLLVFSSVYLSILNEWFNDVSYGNEKTMAVLDQRLTLIENIII